MNEWPEDYCFPDYVWDFDWAEMPFDEDYENDYEEVA